MSQDEDKLIGTNHTKGANMNYNNLSDLEDKALGAFNGDTSEALDVQSLNSN